MSDLFTTKNLTFTPRYLDLQKRCMGEDNHLVEDMGLGLAKDNNSHAPFKWQVWDGKKMQTKSEVASITALSATL